MGKTLLELFKGSTQDKSVKADKETLVEQELTGVRTKSAVELNNPLIYGNEATRIAQRSTPDLEDMKEGTGGEAGDGGLIGKGIGKLTKGKLTSIGDVRDKVNKKLGIPVNQIPSRVIGDIKDQDSQTPVVNGGDGDAKEVGKLLKESAGNPKTILKQAGGKLIGKAKDKLRGALFGSPDTLGAATPEGPKVIEYTDKKTYSNQAKDENRKSYSNKDDFKVGEDKEGKLDLSKVSPIYGVKRKDGLFGKTEYGFINNKNTNVVQSRYSPDDDNKNKYNKGLEPAISSVFGLTNAGDKINLLSPSDKYTLDDNNAFAKTKEGVLNDFIPVWMKKIGSKKPIIFRALISGLTENVSPSWSTSKFAGNPYNFYTFDSIERSTSFNLKMYCNNPVELAVNWEKITKITQMTYPSVGAQFANPPIMRFRIGDIYNNKTGFIESLTYTIPDESNWETDGNRGWLPKIIDVAISIKFIESVGAEDRPYDYTISKAAAKAINDKRGANAEIGASQTEGDGSIPADKPEKVETKGGKALNNAKEDAKSKLNKVGDKVSNTAGAVKSAITKPADQESAKIPENANQTSVGENLKGKSVAEAAKESQGGLTEPQSFFMANWKSLGYKPKKISKKEVPLEYFGLLNAQSLDDSAGIIYVKLFINYSWGYRIEYKQINAGGNVVDLGFIKG